MRRIRRFSILLLLGFLASSFPASAQDISLRDDIEIVSRIMRSRIHAHLLRYDDAIADMDAAIALAPDNPLLYVERGQRIMLLYEWDRALADYDHALELDPAYANAYYYRGILYASVPDASARPAALADFRRYLELAPEGEHAADAARFAADLQGQLDALNAPRGDAASKR